ncbi:MAG: hypothetical protein KKF88_12460 [Alphaproteobacteria bacterium]|nr:hypothetical protein [Alphaproteobacteria bacterium]
MRGWLLGGLSALMLMGATGAAAAQETDPVEGPATLDDRISEDRALIDDLARQLDESFAALAEQFGVESFSIRPMMTALLGDVFEDLPDEGDYAFTVDFEMYGMTDTAGLGAGEADEGERKLRPVYADAQACAAANRDIPVIRFERVEMNGLSGHRCTVSGQSPDFEDAWVYVSWLVLTGPEAYLEVTTGAAVASEEDGYALSSQIGSERLTELNVMAAQIETLAVDTYFSGDEQVEPNAE